MKTLFYNAFTLIFIHLCSLYCIAQDHVYPLMSIHGPDKSPIELIGAEPEYIIWCLQSEFGKHEARKNTADADTSEPEESTEPISLKWKNIVRKEWTDQPFEIRLDATFNSYKLDDGVGNLVHHTRIAFIDKQGKDLLKGKTPSGTRIRKFLQTLLLHSTSYVNSSNGVNVREHPSVTAPIIYKLGDNSKVIIKEKTDQWIDLPKDGDTVRSEWVKVYVRETTYGYVADAYLSPFYVIRSSEIKALNDSLRGYLELTLVDYEKYQEKKVFNKYILDKTDIKIRASLPKTSDGESDSRFNPFYLPINNGKDSLLFFSEHSEYGDITKIYLGRIAALNCYLVETSGFFFDGHGLFDITTGKSIWASVGMPRISVDGKYIIDFYDVDEPELSEDFPVGMGAISERDGDNPFKSRLFHLPYPFFLWSTEDDFWISDDELIIQLYKYTPLHADFTDDKTPVNMKPQYVKLKIVKDAGGGDSK